MSGDAAQDPPFPDITASEALYARARGLIPKATQTLAKGPGQFTRGVAPIYLRRGRGCRVWDVDGNAYLDLNMGIGPISLGYAYARVDRAIAAQLDDGITFSLMHPLEVEVAEMIREVIPGCESVRFSKTGADVCSAAIRLARAHTGRGKVLCCGYHGWHDWYLAVTDRRGGVPAFNDGLTYTFNYNDYEGFLASLDDDVAAVIMEPVVFEAPRDRFLHKVAIACRERGIVLIFDEMWTGFRMALGGAQEHFGVIPDLAVYSKAVANGMPLAVLTGRREIMDRLEHDVFFYTTFGGEALSLAAATIAEMREMAVPQYLARQGTVLRDGYNELCREFGLGFTRCIGYPWRSLVTFDPSAGDPLVVKALLQQEMIRRGILWGGIHNLCFSHRDGDIARVLEAYREALPVVAAAVESGDPAAALRGQPLEPVFRKTSSFNTKPVPGTRAEAAQ
jgi:glutamate-1-semialdehyde 2,1-aminomutase